MKRIVTVFVLLTGLAAFGFAQQGPRPGGPGMGPMMENLKIGEQVIHEMKKITGQMLFSDRLIPSIKEGAIEYTLMIPRLPQLGVNLKQGDTVTLEGIAITYKKADGKVDYFFHPLKAKIGDKEFDFTEMRGKGMRDGKGPGKNDRMGPGHQMMGGPGNRP